MISANLIFVIVAIAIFIVGAVAFFFSRQISNLKEDLKDDDNDVLVQWLKDMKSSMERNTDTLERQLKDQRQTLDEQLKNQRSAMNQQTKLIWERLDNSTEVIRTVQKQLGGIQEFGNDMKDLSNVLKSPKLRGGLGEQFLYDILGNCLPSDLFSTQHHFKSGSVCDAVVFMDSGILPIDSKFPMENFRAMLNAKEEKERDSFKKTFVRDVKNRIDEIASKYILPEEKTTDQAVMYIPSENIFYEIVVNTPSLGEYATQKNVIMASPNTLSYFLKTVLVAYQQHELEKHAKEIIQALAGVKVEVGKFDEDLSVLAKHILHSYKSMETVQSNYQKLYGKIDSIHVLEQKEEPPRIASSE